jgi:hypothetical protein
MRRISISPDSMKLREIHLDHRPRIVFQPELGGRLDDASVSDRVGSRNGKFPTGRLTGIVPLSKSDKLS